MQISALKNYRKLKKHHLSYLSGNKQFMSTIIRSSFSHIYAKSERIKNIILFSNKRDYF